MDNAEKPKEQKEAVAANSDANKSLAGTVYQFH
jgi:hypothetical protein